MGLHGCSLKFFSPRRDHGGMATFPPNIAFGWRELKAKPATVIERSEMERGLAKQRRTATLPVVQVPLVLYFATRAESESFEDWFYSAAGANGGAAWFTWNDPRTNPATPRLVRVVGGELGALVPENKTFSFANRTLTVEYLRGAA